MGPKEKNIIDLKRDGAEKFRGMALGIALKRKQKNVEKANLDEKTIGQLKTLVIL